MTDKEKEIIKNLEEYLQEEMWKYTGPTLGKEECELFLKLLTQKDKRLKGQWLKQGFGDYCCSNCEKHKTYALDYKYCPNCGAEMEVKE